MADYTAFPSATGPGSSVADSPVNLGVEFKVTSTAWLKGIRFWRADTDQDGSIQCRCYQVVTSSTGSAVSGSDGSFTLTGTGWQDVIYGTPIALTVEQRYKAICHFPSGLCFTANYFNAGGPAENGITNGPLHVFGTSTATGGFQGSYNYNSGLAYTDNGVATNYWVTPIVTDTDPAGHPPGNGTATLALSTSRTGVKVATGIGAAALALSASGAGIASRSGLAAAQLGLAASAAGVHRGTGARSSPLNLAASGIGHHRGVGARAAVLGLSASGALPGQDVDVVVGPLETRWAMVLDSGRWRMEEDA
ncbi:Flagellar hook-length control protein FliK [Alloactinosynnema sp. L-07]|uniref:DUF4082 domain-containing protein n=1 Tax=Alloactinosynnema sp. L-07 TaxID=1653480 RepID=UPI00065F0656|nr:DUF4082 domain-containing protein [Alloactinosynnema sp. L-07]CRK59091.1 Flagellar hook-length control protein FliK [Alloactinosynnema sp. L-07]